MGPFWALEIWATFLVRYYQGGVICAPRSRRKRFRAQQILARPERQTASARAACRRYNARPTLFSGDQHEDSGSSSFRRDGDSVFTRAAGPAARCDDRERKAGGDEKR